MSNEYTQPGPQQLLEQAEETIRLLREKGKRTEAELAIYQKAGSTEAVVQRQDALVAQLSDVARVAERLGCYDAADWIRRHVTEPGCQGAWRLAQERAVALIRAEETVRSRGAALSEAGALIETVRTDAYVTEGWLEDAGRWGECWKDVVE